jgi:hypothetical protein
VSALTAIALWLHPALLAVLALRVAAGEPDALWLALGALIAPLVALLMPSRRGAERSRPGAIVTGVVLTLLLAADFLVAADAAALLGGAPWQGVAFAAVVALLVVAWPDAGQAGAPALALGVIGLLFPLGAIAVGTASAPWTAWIRASARPALTFSEGGTWSSEGDRFALDTRVGFRDGQRVTAVAPGTFRVIERDTPQPTVREWKLGAGETLALRPGDELAVVAGARLRFEAGRRVPGAPASGADWADAPGRDLGMLPLALGALVTLVGGALALVPAPGRGDRTAVAGPVTLLLTTAGMVSWGVYAAAVAPELALGGSSLAAIVRLPALVLGTRGRVLALLALLALAFVLLAVAASARARLASVAGPAPGFWAASVLVAAALALTVSDPWWVLLLGLGLAAAALAPMRLAVSPAGAVAGGVVGAFAFVALAALPVLAPGAPAWLGGFSHYPALLAMPLGLLMARLLGTGQKPASRAGRKAGADRVKEAAPVA